MLSGSSLPPTMPQFGVQIPVQLRRPYSSPPAPSCSLEALNDQIGEFAFTLPTLITLPITSLHNKHLSGAAATSLTPISLKPQSHSDVLPITVNPAAAGRRGGPEGRAGGASTHPRDLCFKVSGTQTGSCDRLISINYLN